jgi:tRNA threonylcarbamoyladenosine biosynthesis protein TsaB
MLDARRMEVYAQIFDSSLSPLTAPGAFVVDPDTFGDYIDPAGELLIFGPGATKCLGVLPSKGVRYLEAVPSARGLAAPAHASYAAGKFDDVAYVEPLYLKDFIVTPSRKALF